MKRHISDEAKAGFFFASILLMVVGFAAWIGIQNPVRPKLRFWLDYQFAGGIEEGSPLRIAGIKAGKVESIRLFPEPHIPVRIEVSAHRDAAFGIRHDSQFFINIAGIIGEHYIEVTPGKGKPVLEGETLIGMDPPRIDQLLSQSFALAGKIQDIIEEHKPNVTRTIELLVKLSDTLNKTLAWVDKNPSVKRDGTQLMQELLALAKDLRSLTEAGQSPEAKQTLKTLQALIQKLEPLDGPTIRQFFQKEGVKVKVF